MSADLQGAAALPDRAARGALYGAGAGLLLGLLDVVACAGALLPQFDDAAAWAQFAGRQLLLPLAAATCSGFALALLLTVFEALARRGTGRDGRAAHSRLGTYLALALLPYLGWLLTQMFSGPQAQRMAGRPAFIAIGVLGGAFCVRTLTAFISARRAQAARQSAFAALSAMALLASFWVDRTVLPRLYPWFHGTLKGVALLAALGLFFFLDLQPRETGAETAIRRRAWIFALLFVPLSCVVSGAALARLYRASVLRSHILEQSTIGAAVMGPYAAYRARTGGTRNPILPPPMAALPGAESAPPTYSGPRLGGHDVFLITVDALRFDRLLKMPFVATLAARGVVFDRAYTQVPHTSFAIATLLTGKPVYALMTLGQDAASHETLPTVLRRFRYKTAAFYPPSVFYIDHDRLKRLEESAYGFEYVKFEYLNGDKRTDQVIAFLQGERPERAFAWVHYLEPHEPYELHPDLPTGPGQLLATPLTARSADRDRYDGEVAFVDREIRRLVAYLEANRPGAMIILAADHGEEFSEHGGRYHGTTLFEELVHVPLVFSQVGATPLLTPRHIATPVGLLDVAPTLLGLLDIERSARMRGRDLSPWLLTGRGDIPPAPVFAEIGRKKMVMWGDHKLICDLATDSCQAFDLARDPAERHNVLDAQPAQAAQLRAMLDRSLAEARRFEEEKSAAPAIDPQLLSRARLGDRAVLPLLLPYLQGADAPANTAAVDQRMLLSLVAPLLATRLPADPPGSADPLAALLRDDLLGRLAHRFAAATRDGDTATARWAAMALVRLQFASPNAPADADVIARATAVLVTLLQDDQADAEQRLCGALAIAVLPQCRAPEGIVRASSGPTAGGATSVDCVTLWAQALPAVLGLQDADRARPLLQLIGRSHAPRALTPLLALLDNVLSRADIVAALGTLGQAGAIPALGGRLREDPYVHVRVAAATALGALSGQYAGARAALVAASKTEREPAVQAAIRSALPPRPPAKP